jgi:hypothetical protein
VFEDKLVSALNEALLKKPPGMRPATRKRIFETVAPRLKEATLPHIAAAIENPAAQRARFEAEIAALESGARA